MNIISKDKEAFKAITDIINKYDDIVIYHHIRPDGDCIGAQFGLSGTIKTNFKNKNVYTAEGEYGFSYLSYLNVKFDDYSKVDKSKSLAIVVDTAVVSRIDGGEELKDFAEVLVIDHHPNECDVTNELTTHVRLDNRPSCAQIIGEYCLDQNFDLDKHSAEVTYHGIVTDTGRFQYRGVNGKTFAVAKWLDKKGIDKDYLYEKLYERTIEDIEFQKFIYSKLEFTKDKKVAFVKITAEDQKKLNVTPDQCARVNSIGGIKGVESWNFFIQYPDFVRVEFRSSVRVEVNQVAFKWNGGGHRQAAGCRLDSMDQVKDVVKNINECVNGEKLS